jgi:hypothetical protein
MIGHLNWKTLADRRTDARLVMLKTVKNDFVESLFAERTIAVWVVSVWVVFGRRECMFWGNITGGMSMSVFGVRY